MGEKRVSILSIAGFDPSGGAGILADIKTFEGNKVSGMGVVTAITFQNDIEFLDVKWIDTNEIIQQILTLKKRFDFEHIKIGLIKDLDALSEIIQLFKNDHVRIIWDPIVRATAGFEFHQSFDKTKLGDVMKSIFLITPNIDEAQFMTAMNDPMKAGLEIAKHTNVLLKGGHNNEEPGVDCLFTENGIEKLFPEDNKIFAKHGSGCVLSSTIIANLAQGYDLYVSCKNAKKYVEDFLSSSPSLIGTHHV